MIKPRFQKIALATFIFSLTAACQPSTQPSPKANVTGSDDDLEAIAIMLVDEELANSDLIAQVNEDGVDQAVQAKKDKLQKQQTDDQEAAADDQQKPAKPDKQQKAKALSEAKAKFDANGNGKLDATEREAMKAALKTKIAGAKGDQEKGWIERKDEICQQVKDKIAASTDELQNHPMYDRVIARCEGAEIPEKGSLMSNSGDICAKVKQMVASQQEPSEGLTAIAAKCDAGTFGSANKPEEQKSNDNAAKDKLAKEKGKPEQQ